MADDGVLRFLLSPATPLYVLAALAAVGISRVLPNVMARINERRRDTAAEKANDWTRLRDEIDRLDSRCQRLEESEERCHRELAEALGRIAQIEGWQAGQGDVRQAAALAAAEVREAARKAEGKKP